MVAEEEMENVGIKFFNDSAYTSKGVVQNPLDEPIAPLPKILGDEIKLIHSEPESGLFRLIKNRRTIRSFDDRAISLEQLARLLWAVQGITKSDGNIQFRSVASAGNRHPFNTYVLANRVENLKQGLYIYNPVKESLGLTKKGYLGEELAEACLGQKSCQMCSVAFIWTAVTARTTARYQARGYRYIFLDAGHIGAQLQLACVDMGLGSCNIAAYLDDAVSALVGIKSDFELPVYIAVVGWPK